MNVIIICGRLGQDPELRQTKNGNAVCNISVATDNWRKDTTEWHRVTAWGKTAEFVANHLRKGSFVQVQGQLTYRKWTTAEGDERVSAEIDASDIRADGNAPKERTDGYGV
jgi:single-strand DNA-binding protein